MPALVSKICKETRSGVRQRALRAAGINPALFNVPSHRFASHAVALEWLAAEGNVQRLADVLRGLKDGRSAKKVAALDDLLGDLADSWLVASLHFAGVLSAGVPEAIKLSEQVTPSDRLVAVLNALWRRMLLYHENHERLVLDYLAKHGLVWTSEEIENVANRIARAAEDAHATFLNHLTAEDD